MALAWRLGVGTASFFSDAGHEIATSVLPSFLTSTLHVGLAKLAGGPLSHDPERRARLATGGYRYGARDRCDRPRRRGVAGRRPAGAGLGLAWDPVPGPGHAADVARPTAGLWTGVRVERAGDNAGAIVGPLLASVLVAVVGIRHAIWFAVVPGLLAAVAITVAAQEARRTVATPAGSTHALAQPR